MAEERITLYCPNGKHGVNTLNCKVKHEEKFVKPNGTIVTNEEIEGFIAQLEAFKQQGVEKTIDELLEENEITKKTYPVYPEGWQVLTDEQVKGLENKTLAWVDGKLVSYKMSEAELTIERANARKEEAQKELNLLLVWFRNIYDAQIKQAERCERLGIPYDNKYGTVAELDQLAEEKASRINELKEIIGAVY